MMFFARKRIVDGDRKTLLYQTGRRNSRRSSQLFASHTPTIPRLAKLSKGTTCRVHSGNRSPYRLQRLVKGARGKRGADRKVRASDGPPGSCYSLIGVGDKRHRRVDNRFTGLGRLTPGGSGRATCNPLRSRGCRTVSWLICRRSPALVNEPVSATSRNALRYLW